ncbi:MAG: hypothetical protein AAF499_06600 [Pseudomonadota bacterium]
MIGQLAATLLSVALFSAQADEGDEDTFRSLFEVWYAENKPSDSPASPAAQALLAQHQPEVYKAATQPGFIDFYADYIGKGYLQVDGQRFDAVDRALLNQFRLDPSARFIHVPAPTTQPAVAYARYDRDGFDAGGERFEFEFLTYNYVFAHSGLPRGLRWWQRALAGLVNGNRDWHQLDHYVAATLALYQGEPIALTLQQHNYLTTWRIPEDLKLGPAGRVQLDVAIGSNELYPHAPERTRHPTVSFITPGNIEFVMTGKKRPMLGAYDVTDGQESIAYDLTFLPPSDAFYGFRGTLGKKRRLPGRSGPPGADYNTLPGIKPYPIAMAVGWRGPSMEEARRKLAAVLDGWQVNQQGVQAAIDAFVEATKLSAD